MKLDAPWCPPTLRLILVHALIVLLPWPGIALAAPPEPPLKQWLRDAGAARARVGMSVQAVDDGTILASHNADAALNPASVIKLLTVWAGLGIIGPDYRWRTRFYLLGPLRDGVLDGDLLVVGGGDPKLVVEDLTELIARLRANGLHHINGNLLLDDSLYQVTGAATAFDGLPSEPYNVQPNAAMMNFKSTKFTLIPARGRVRVELDPPLAGVRIDNRLKLRAGRCRHRASDITVVSAGSDTQPVIRLEGQYSKGCRTGWSFHAVLNHRQFIDAFFRAGWTAAGGRWQGRARFASGRLAAIGAAANVTPTPWFEWQSPRTLADVVTDINKFSNNVMSRQLVLHMAAISNARPANQVAGMRALSGFIALQDLHLPQLVMDNGSGLSRRTRISAAGLTSALRRIAASPFADQVRESLPVAGVDGTMRWRLKRTPVAGRAWIKTGSLDAVRSVAGYIRARSGRLFAMSMIVNGAGARLSHRAQDRLIRWVYDRG